MTHNYNRQYQRGSTYLGNGALLGADNQIGLGIVAVGAEHVLANKAIEEVLQLGGVVTSIDDEALVLEIKLGLGAELAAKELGRIGCRSADGLGDLDHVDDDGLDTVSLALDLGLDTGHLVAIESVADAAIDIEATHDDAVAAATRSGESVAGRLGGQKRALRDRDYVGWQ